MAFSYRTYNQVIEDVIRWEPHIPPVSGVCGVPRSGMLAASIISQIRHIPLVPIESLVNGTKRYRPSCSRSLHTVSGPVLVLDDTSSLGRTKRELRKAIKHPHVLLGAVYASDKSVAEQLVDVAGYRIMTPYHSFEYNLFRDGTALTLLTDFDGVLCPDWHRKSDAGPHQAEYEEWINNVPSQWLVTQPIHGIVTARLEKYRPQTVAWLQRHGIRYKHLLMHPGNDPAQRNPVRHKVAAYRQLARRTTAFVESCPVQSAAIAKATGWPVLCFQTGQLHNPTHMPPRWT